MTDLAAPARAGAHADCRRISTAGRVAKPMQLPQGSLAAAGVAIAEGVSSHMLSFLNIRRHNMNKLFTAVTLGALIAGPLLVQPANAQRLDPARARDPGLHGAAKSRFA